MKCLHSARVFSNWMENWGNFIGTILGEDDFCCSKNWSTRDANKTEVILRKWPTELVEDLDKFSIGKIKTLGNKKHRMIDALSEPVKQAKYNVSDYKNENLAFFKFW